MSAKVGTILNSLKRKIFDEKENNNNHHQDNNINNCSIEVSHQQHKKKRNKYYYQQQTNTSTTPTTTTLLDKFVTDLKLNNIVSSLKSYLFNRNNSNNNTVNNKTFSLFNNPFSSFSSNNNNNHNNNHHNNNKRSTAYLKPTPPIVNKRLPKSNSNRKRNSLSVPRHFHTSLTSTMDNNKNNNNNKNSNNISTPTKYNTLDENNQNNVTQYDSDDNGQSNNVYIGDIIKSPKSRSFIDDIQNQKETDKFTESVNSLVNDFSQSSLTPSKNKTTTTTTTTSTEQQNGNLIKSPTKFSDAQYYNNSPKKIQSPKKFGIEEKPIVISDSEDEESENELSTTIKDRENGNQLQWSTTTGTMSQFNKSLISSLRPKETPSFETIIKSIELDDDNKFKEKLVDQAKQEREEEIKLLLKKLSTMTSNKDGGISLLKTIEKRMETEKNKKQKLRPLTNEENKIIDNAFNTGRADDKISELPFAEVTRSDVRLLGPGKWLNDEVINFYLEVLKLRQDKTPKTDIPQCHFFSTFFYPALCNNNGTYNYDKVRRWTSKFNIFILDKIIIPIHLGSHWCLAIINFKEKQFEYYDSFTNPNYECLKKLRRYVNDEMKNKNREGAVNVDEFKDYTPVDIPHQLNGFDCGVFCCKYADYNSRGSKLTFSQEDMPQFRRRMALEIIKKSCLDN